MGKKKPLLLGLLPIVSPYGFFLNISRQLPRAESCAPGVWQAQPRAHHLAPKREVSPPVPQNPSCPIPGGPLGSCRGIASLLAAHGPGKVSVHSCLGSTPPFWVSILLFDRFWGDGAKWVPS